MSCRGSCVFFLFTQNIISPKFNVPFFCLNESVLKLLIWSGLMWWYISNNSAICISCAISGTWYFNTNIVFNRQNTGFNFEKNFDFWDSEHISTEITLHLVKIFNMVTLLFVTSYVCHQFPNYQLHLHKYLIFG